MMQRVQALAGRLLHRVRVNHVQQSTRDGVPVFVKRRRAVGAILIWLANRLLTLARSGTRMIVDADEWIAWEVDCARLLYPERPGVTAGPGAVVTLPKVDGVSVRALLHRDHAEGSKALRLAARELRRVHQLHCSRYHAAWSHGDLHLDNIVCDLQADQAVLIDFDIRHERAWSQTQRQADDLASVVLELMGLPDERWRQRVATFLGEYRDLTVLHELRRQLIVPRGVARFWWYVRTHGAPLDQIEPRLEDLRTMIESMTSGNP